MILFREKYIRPQSGTKWTDKWTNFLRNKEESLNDWYFDEKLVIEKYVNYTITSTKTLFEHSF
jgi:hypothetical protein